MLNRKKMINLLTVTAAITGVAAIAQPIDADAAISAKNSVTKAEKLAVQLKKDINYGARKKANPKTAVGLPNDKLYKQTKTAYNKALAETKNVKNTKERKVLQTRLAQKVKPVIERTDKYREAVQMGLELKSASNVLNERVQAANLNENTKKQYDQVSTDLKKLDKQIKRVYGKTTRPALTKEYSDKASAIVSTAKYSLSFKSDTDNFINSFNNEDYEKALTYYTSLNKLLSENKVHNYVGTSSELYKKLYAAYSPTLDDYKAWGKLYIATSKSATDPTLSGGKTPEKTISYTKDVTVAAGEERYIKLRNANIGGNLNIIGVNKGAGTITLENVKVSALKNNGGQIVVKDIAEKSLHLNGITAKELIVNDVNGSNIVAGAGAKIANLLVSDQAGGNVNLHSSLGDTFGTINLESTHSKAINFAGNFDKSNVVVKGNEQNVNFAAGTAINELTIKAGATVTAAENVKISELHIDPVKKGENITLSGDLKDTVVVVNNADAIIKISENTVVGEIKVDPSVKGEVKVEDQGSIINADESIELIGNPVAVTELKNVTAEVGGNEVAMTSDNVIDLTGTSNEDMFTRVKITADNAEKLVLDSVKVRGAEVNLMGSTPLEYQIAGSTTLSVKDLLGSHDLGDEGISMGNLRTVLLNKPIVIKGYLNNENEDNKDIDITIKLGDSKDLPTTYENDYVTITKNGLNEKGKHKATVEINKDKYHLTIGDIDESAGGVEFIDLLLSYMGTDIKTDNALINALIGKAGKKEIEQVPLGILVKIVKKIESNKYIIEFKER
ncbi:hypothetical protein MHI18_10115 [Peribacillus sp. FSL H8-0477]|uniref:hypothetical protein n=1 Tax=Peribacillus sp. FSL H8-0477 TaxID=2921388 RepID=UPI0030FB9A96